ncbi:CooT family nickel-binding protein [Candidatus Magnetomoraceae bacterium gMMP-15]
MCEANAFLIKAKDKEESLIMEAVDTVEPYEDGIRLTSIFGDQKFLKAHVHALELVDHRVVLMENLQS